MNKKQLSKLLGEKVLFVKNLTQGADHEVYKVRTSAGAFIVKRPLRGGNKVNNERFGTEFARRKNLPAPRVVAVKYGWIIETVIPGRLLGLTSRSTSAYHVMGKELRRLHGRMKGFGPLEAGRGKFASMEAYVLSWYRVWKKGQGAAAAAYFKRSKHYLRASQSVLLHNDLVGQNLLSKGHKFTGFIDFGDIIAGPPALDFAWIYVEHPNDEVFKAAVRGYGKRIDLHEVRFYAFLLLTRIIGDAEGQVSKRLLNKRKRLYQSIILG